MPTPPAFSLLTKTSSLSDADPDIPILKQPREMSSPFKNAKIIGNIPLGGCICSVQKTSVW